MRVLLVYPNGNKEIIGWGDLGAIAEPLALEYIAAAAKMDGHEAQLVDLRLYPNALDETLRNYQPDVVGVTGYSMHVLRNLSICQRAKELVPGCKTIVGGHHATLLPEDFLEPQMDFVVEGEGCDPFRRIMARLDNGQTVQNLAGVWSRVNGDFVYGGPPGAFDIDSIPVPDRTLTAKERSCYYIDWMHPIALLRTTVGCPYRCSFCSLWKIMDGRYVKRDLTKVVEELHTIPEDYVFLVDDEPFVDPKRMKKLAAYIQQTGIQKEYFAYCRVDSFLRDRELMEMWHEIGLRRVFFGVETIVDHELQDYNKRQKREQIIEAYQVAKEIGINIFSGFIINPSYTETEFKAVTDFIRDYDIEYPSFTILTPLPGAELGATFDHITERQPNGRPNWEYYDLQNPVIETKLPRQEFMRLYNSLYYKQHGEAYIKHLGVRLNAYKARLSLPGA